VLASYIGANKGDGVYVNAPKANLENNYVGMNDGAAPAGADAWPSFFDRSLNSRGCYWDSHRCCRLKLLHVCDQSYPSWESTSLPVDTVHSVRTLKVTLYFGNMGYGVSASYNAEGLALSNNLVGGNGLAAVRYDQAEGADGSAQFTDSNHIILTNGWGQQACTLCMCSTLGAATESAGGIEVDCSVPGTDGPRARSRAPTARSVRDLGPSFPLGLPADTTVLTLSGVNLETMDWEQLVALESLRVLALNDNPNLDPVRCAVFDRNLLSRGLPLSFTPMLRLKRCHACDQWHSSRMSTPLTSSHCISRPNTEGPCLWPFRHLVAEFRKLIAPWD
jgi:hypothetical protein